MNIAFSSRELRSICELAEEADAHLGSEVASEFRGRLADLAAAQTLADLPFELVPSTTQHDLALSFGDSYAIVLAPSHIPCPVTPDGGVDSARVTRVKITRIDGLDD